MYLDDAWRVGDTDTKKNSGAPNAGMCLRNLNHNKDKSSENQGTNAASGQRPEIAAFKVAPKE